MQNLTYNLKRAAGYMLGFVLFYEPFMFFNQLASTFITDTSFSSIHVPCARIPLANIVTGEWLATSTISLIFCLLLAVTSLWFGPLFCGKLCPTGAFSELLGSLLPDKYKIDWVKLVPVLPLRSGVRFDLKATGEAHILTTHHCLFVAELIARHPIVDPPGGGWEF